MLDTIKSLLKLLPLKFNVSFALYCALDVSSNLSSKDIEAHKCIELTQKWLNDPTSVSIAELDNAAYNAANAAYAAYNAAYNAAYAAYAASSAAYAAYAASSAAYAASSAASSAAREKKLIQYENELRRMIKSLTRVEKEIYNLTNIEDNV